MIKAIIFDFAGVISTEAYWMWLSKNVSEFGTKQEYFMEIADKIDKADISNDDFVKILSEETGIPAEEIRDSVFEELVINTELLALIEKLKKHYKLGLLSNYHGVWLRHLLEKYELYPYFDEVIISSEHKIIKPEPEIFHKMVTMLGVAENESVFIDDKQKNADASERVGMHGLLFTTNEKLKEDFQKLGMTIA